MGNSIRIATIGGIEIGIHYSWLLVFLLVAGTLAVGTFPQEVPGLEATTYWTMGFAASFFLFVSVLIHELAHSFMAEARGLKVKGISLFIFGGVSNIASEPASARDEFLISAVGPLASLLLGVLFWGVFLGVGAAAAPLQAVLLYLAFINVLLAVFNLIPGFPLDGGRVLRAAAWWVTGSLRTATRVGVWSGRVVASLFILGGLYLAFTGATLSGLWLMLIGWFLHSAADASGRQMEEAERLRGVTVGDVMNPRPLSVEPETPLARVVQGLILQRAVWAVPVVNGDGRLVGMITLHEIRSVPRERWDETPVEAVMAGAGSLRTARPEDDLESALGVLGEHDTDQLPVVEDGRLVGLLSRGNLLRLLQIRQELGLPTESEEEEERRRAA